MRRVSVPSNEAAPKLKLPILGSDEPPVSRLQRQRSWASTSPNPDSSTRAGMLEGSRPTCPASP